MAPQWLLFNAREHASSCAQERVNKSTKFKMLYDHLTTCPNAIVAQR